jgi:hypothetical protein
MAKRYFVRIELHGENDYTELHKEMKSRGFSRKITVEGTKKKLPTGCYIRDAGSGCTSRAQAVAKAQAAAKAVGHDDPEIVVIKTEDRLSTAGLPDA